MAVLQQQMHYVEQMRDSGMLDEVEEAQMLKWVWCKRVNWVCLLLEVSSLMWVQLQEYGPQSNSLHCSILLCSRRVKVSLCFSTHFCWPRHRRSQWHAPVYPSYSCPPRRPVQQLCSGVDPFSGAKCSICAMVSTLMRRQVQHLCNGVDPAGHWRSGSATCTTRARTGLPPPLQKCWGTSPSCARHHATCWRWVGAGHARHRLGHTGGICSACTALHVRQLAMRWRWAIRSCAVSPGH